MRERKQSEIQAGIYNIKNKTEEQSLESLPNIGIKIAEKLKRIGIKNRKDFLKKDPYKIFNQLLKKVDPTLCRCALASVVGAYLSVPWHEITKKSAKEFSARYPDHKWGKCQIKRLIIN